MNRKNFETVLEQYMGRLAGLEQADDSDQVYKWRAVGCFKRFWNLDAADFAGMFEKAMREAGNLLDDAAMQPVAGLRMLLAREAEVEYVRECFRFYSVMTAVIFRNARTVQSSLQTRSMNGFVTTSAERKNIYRPGIM